MKGLEDIILDNKIVAKVLRESIKTKSGIHFFSNPNEPLQLAIHNHPEGKKTHLHSNIVLIPVKLKQKYKYLYIVSGQAKIELNTKDGQAKKSISLQKGDCIIIMDVLHKVVFSKKSKAIEIKQGPYEKT